jgi:hypothetical protein
MSRADSLAVPDGHVQHVGESAKKIWNMRSDAVLVAKLDEGRPHGSGYGRVAGASSGGSDLLCLGHRRVDIAW